MGNFSTFTSNGTNHKFIKKKNLFFKLKSYKTKTKRLRADTSFAALRFS